MKRKKWRDQRKEYIASLESAGLLAWPLIGGQAMLTGLYLIHDLSDELGIPVDEIEPMHVIYAIKKESAKFAADQKAIEDYQCKPTHTRGLARLDKRTKAYRSQNKPNA